MRGSLIPPERTGGDSGGRIERPLRAYLLRFSPGLILLVALTAVFVFGHDRSHFYRPGHHDWLSSLGLAKAANFSPDHAFLMFERRTLAPEMDYEYVLKNGFPPGAFALTALAIAPFDGLSSQILAARMLMLLFFAAAAVVAWLSLRRLFDSWAALAAVLLSCSSWYALYYSDMIFNDVPALFGVLLAFHGIVVFVQEGRFRQLVVKSCAALLLGWQVYALLLPFIAFGAADALRRRAPRGSFREAGRAVAAVLCGRHVVLGVVTLLFGVLILGINLANEYRAFGGELLWTEVPTFHRMLWRFGLKPEAAYAAYTDRLAWWPYLQQQAASIGGMSLPFLAAGKADQSSVWLMAVGAGACVAHLREPRRVRAVDELKTPGGGGLQIRPIVLFHKFVNLVGHAGIAAHLGCENLAERDIQAHLSPKALELIEVEVISISNDKSHDAVDKYMVKNECDFTVLMGDGTCKRPVSMLGLRTGRSAAEQALLPVPVDRPHQSFLLVCVS